MNCHEHRSNLIEFARGGPLGPAEEQELKDHLDRCPDCVQSLEQQQRLNAAIEILAMRAAATLAPEHLEKRLLAELDAIDGRREARPRNTRRWNGRPSRRWIAVVGGAVAASLLAGWFLIGRRAPAPGVEYARPYSATTSGDTDQAPATGPVPGPPPAASAETIRAGSDPGAAQAARSNPRRLARQPGSALAASGNATAPTAAAAANDNPSQPFIAIPYTEPLAPYERASVMRMDLPVAAVMAAGLPVEAQDTGEHIRADVIVGEDGRARAIRLLFVSNSGSDRRK